MKIARIAVLMVALTAGGGAAFMLRSTPQPAPVAAPEPPPVPKVEILVAATDLALGQGVKAQDLRWQSWPAEAAIAGLITRTQTPGAVEELTGSTVRNAFVAGEPIRREKLVKGTGGFMSAILPSGMRAVAISIDTRGATSAGGFILPNDRVDVIRTITSGDTPTSEIILANIRVLAIGQTIQERNGEKVITGETATLELAPQQAELVALSQKVGQLSLALRSLADVNETGTPKRQGSKSLEIIRFGVSHQGPAQ